MSGMSLIIFKYFYLVLALHFFFQFREFEYLNFPKNSLNFTYFLKKLLLVTLFLGLMQLQRWDTETIFKSFETNLCDMGVEVQ